MLNSEESFYSGHPHHHQQHYHAHEYEHRRVQGSISPSSSCSETSSGSLGSSSFPFKPNPKNGSSLGPSSFQFQPNLQPQSLTQFQTGSGPGSSCRFGSLQLQQHEPPIQPKSLLQPLNGGQWISRWVVACASLAAAKS